MDNEFERTMNDAANAAKEAFSKRNGKKNKKSGKMPGFQWKKRRWAICNVGECSLR